MRIRMKMLCSLFLISSLVVFGSGLSFGKTDIIPGGPWLTDNQNVSYSALSSYEELVKALKQIEKTSKGLVQLESIGVTNQGRDIYMAKIGNPDNTPVMIMTQQHGNEPIGTESALQVIKFLATDNAKVQQILNELYVLIIVRVNPDGAELWQRYDYDPTAPASSSLHYLYCREGVGWDINRYHFFDWTKSPLYEEYMAAPLVYPYPENPVPEAVAVMNAFKMYQPIWMVDFHGQGTYVTNDGESVTSSTLWPTNPDAPNEAVILSKQLIAVMMDHMEQYGYATLSLYPGGTEPGIARNQYGIQGAGSVLVEMKGGIGQKSLGMLVKHAAEQMEALLAATADGSLYMADPDRVNDLPTERISYYKDLPPPHGEDVEPE